MSPAYIIGIIAALLITLTGYAFVSQSIDKRRKQKQRMLTALKNRVRNFKHLISGFPPDFLSHDLQILVNRCLVDAIEQLALLEPSEKSYVDELQQFNTQLEEIKRKPTNSKRKQLENPQQVKDVQAYLQELNNFIGQMVKRGNITPTQKTNYERQIKMMTLQITVDAYLLNGKQAQKNNKVRLAIHYYTLALKLLTKENSQGDYQKQISQLTSVIAQLETKLTEEDPTHTTVITTASNRDPNADEWDKITENEDGWKKKSLYD